MSRIPRSIIFSAFVFATAMLALAQPPTAMNGFYNLSEPGSSAAAEKVLKANLLEPLSAGLRESSVATAYLDALGILEEKGTCSDFFGGSEASTLVLKELVTKLEEVPLKSRDVGLRMFGEITTVKNMRLNISYRMFEKAIVNTKGPFFQSGGNWKHVGSFTSSSREARALMLLHELAHLMTNPNGDYLIPDDGKGNHPMLSVQNSKTIEATCRAPLLALKRKPQLNLQELAKLIIQS